MTSRLDMESASLLLLVTWARKVMTRAKNRAKGVSHESVGVLIGLAHAELDEASQAIAAGEDMETIAAELGDAAAYIGIALWRLYHEVGR